MKPDRFPKLLRAVPTLTVVLFLGPVFAGTLATILPSIGILPALDRWTPTLDPWASLWGMPGILTATGLSLWVGVTATLASVLIAILVMAAWAETPAMHRVRRWISPILAIPHAALAIGLAFLLAPSGWIVRALSPWATGYDRPPDWTTINDPLGLALIVGLVLKEVPFLILVSIAATQQVPARQALIVARTMGYGPVTAWLKVVLPMIYPQIRLPIFAVLAFSVSVVDMALVLGPNTPPPLAIMVVRWLNDPDLTLRLVGSAGAIWQCALVGAALLTWILGERLIRLIGRHWIGGGARGAKDRVLRAAAGIIAAIGAFLAFSGFLILALWSVTGRWRFPESLPTDWSGATILRHADRLGDLAGTTICVAGLATGLAIALTLACLENEQRNRLRPTSRVLWLIYLPLLVPQVGFLFGVQILAVRTGTDGTMTALVWSHLLFVLPYVFLTLADSYRSFDQRYLQIAWGLGQGPNAAFWRVRIPMMLRPILTATAIGIAVSVALYLPTLFLGAGRHPTLTTEAVGLASGADRRVVGVYAFAQAIVPFIGFALALALPNRLYRKRRALRQPL